MLTRRYAILIGAGAAASALRLEAGEFWEDKPRSEWTDKEVQKLLTRSPWAKETTVNFRGAATRGGGGPIGGPDMGGPGMGGPGTGGPGMGGPGGGGPGMGGPGMGQGPLPGGGRGTPPGGADEGVGGMRSARALVRWESALPIREAEGGKLPAPVESNYLISVSGIPMPMPGGATSGESDRSMPQRRDAMLEEFKTSTSLRRKGKDPIKPDSVMEAPGAGHALLFVFPHGTDPITPEDKEVTFIAEPGPMEIKTKFSLKDMKYHGKLEL
jgi:hypothetical protein